MLAVKFSKMSDIAVQSQASYRPQFHITLGNAGHCARQAQTDRANTGVRHAAIAVLTGTESFSLCQKLGVNLTADYDFVFIDSHYLPSFTGIPHPLCSSSQACASCKIFASLNILPANWMPIGRPSPLAPAGTEIDGIRARFTNTV